MIETLLRLEHELALEDHAYYAMFLEHVSPERPRSKDLGLTDFGNSLSAY